MKRFLLIVTLMVGAFAMLSAQTLIVDTLPANKKAILEEFTGIKCVYCPDGHKIAQQIMNANPGNVFAINIHTGGYAAPSAGQPDFRTPFGAAIAGQSGLVGYPAGTVNRHLFPGQQQGSGTAQSRTTWANTSANTLTQASYLNVGVESVIDASNRQLSVHVQVYYTGGTTTINKLNVALLQDNLEGPQTGGAQFNPTQVLPNGNYNHSHMLRHLLTGQWGITIPVTAAGTLYDTTITYVLPAEYTSVPVNLGDLHLVAFVAEGQQEIISGNGSHPSITGLNTVNNVGVDIVGEMIKQCKNTLASDSPTLIVSNMGSADATSVDFAYDINGSAGTYTWTGQITPLSSATVTLPAISYTVGNTNTFNVSVVSVNSSPDEDTTNNMASTSFDSAPEVSSSKLYVEIKPDAYGSEITWEVLQNGSTIATGGPYTDGNTAVVNVMVSLPTTGGCFEFIIYDSYGDGINAPGYYKLTSGGVVIDQGGADYTTQKNVQFSRSGVGVEENENAIISVYPNPTHGQINIENAEGAIIEVYNLIGERVYRLEKANQFESIDLSNMVDGTYYLRTIKDGKSYSQAIILTK